MTLHHGYQGIELLDKFDTAKCLFNKKGIKIYECSNMVDNKHTSFIFFKHNICFYKEFCEGNTYSKEWISKFIFKTFFNHQIKFRYSFVDENILN